MCACMFVLWWKILSYWQISAQQDRNKLKNFLGFLDTDSSLLPDESSQGKTVNPLLLKLLNSQKRCYEQKVCRNQNRFIEYQFIAIEGKETMNKAAIKAFPFSAVCKWKANILFFTLCPKYLCFISNIIT